jgi:hypothetical protein
MAWDETASYQAWSFHSAPVAQQRERQALRAVGCGTWDAMVRGWRVFRVLIKLILHIEPSAQSSIQRFVPFPCQNKKKTFASLAFFHSARFDATSIVSISMPLVSGITHAWRTRLFWSMTTGRFGGASSPLHHADGKLARVAFAYSCTSNGGA